MLREIFLDKKYVADWLKKKRIKPLSDDGVAIRYVDLFSGCGGLSYGIQSAALELGFQARSALAIDLKPNPLKVYASNISHEADAILNMNVLDVFNLDANSNLTRKELELKNKIGNVNILVAGPPCQGHSDLNNSTRRKDPRNNLYMACIRAVEIFEPDFICIENVPTVIHASEGVVQSTVSELAMKGYFVKTLTVNFLDLGIPQARKRHILVASKNQHFINSLAVSDIRKQVVSLREYISDVYVGEDRILFQSGKLSATNIERVDFLFENNLYDLPDHCRPACHRDKQHSYKSSYGRLNMDFPAQTITSGFGSMGQGRYIHPTERRTINPREAARIQGFPDRFDFSTVGSITELREIIANAVPPQLTYVLTRYYLQEFYATSLGKVKKLTPKSNYSKARENVC